MLSNENRLRLLSLFVLLFALILVGKLYLVQIVSGSAYRDKAEHQYIAGANYFDRGSIYFSTKDGTLVPAAAVKDGYTVAIKTSEIDKSELESIYSKISAITPVDHEQFIEKSRRENRYEEIAKKIDRAEAEKIQALKIPGVVVAKTRWRVYPGETMASHALGLVGYSGDELAGRYGLERQYENILKREGDTTFVNFFAEIFSNIKKTVSPDEHMEGDIVTTIEPSAEAFLETELDKVNATYGSEFTAGIVIDPHTGEILAMAQSPAFDPNNPQKESSSTIFSNKLVEDRYEMGSIIKALTMAAGLDSGAVSARTTYNDPGCMTLNSRTFCNYDGQSRGANVPMQTVLNNSLNTGVAYVVSRMGNKSFSDYMFKFGVDEKTGIDLPNEGASLVSNLKTNRDLEHAQASFGQGIALTPIGTVRALSALANGGTLITPHLVKEVRYKIGTTKTLDYPAKEDQPRVISPEASEEISRMLTHTVDHSLRAGTVRLENYSVAAKTGTAQIAREGGGGYYEDRYLHSFFGYFPSYDPQFLIFFYTYYPKDVQFASETLTSSFINTVKFLISYYGIQPDRETVPPERI